MIEWIGRWACHLFCGVAAAVLVVMLVEMFNRSDVISFGDPAKSCVISINDTFNPDAPCVGNKVAEIAPGEPLQMCFGDLTWFRLVPSRATMFFFDRDNLKRDLDSKLEPIAAHRTPLPAHIGPLKPKCRISQMPRGIPPGSAILTGVFTSEDTFLGVTRVVTTEYPRMRLIAKAP